MKMVSRGGVADIKKKHTRAGATLSFSQSAIKNLSPKLPDS